jgi:hypothetical protein
MVDMPTPPDRRRPGCPALARVADAHGERLLAEVGFRLGGDGAGRGSQSGSGPSGGQHVRSPARTWLPLAWRAPGPESLLPSLDGELEIVPLGARTKPRFSAQYLPPLGADRARWTGSASTGWPRPRSGNLSIAREAP